MFIVNLIIYYINDKSMYVSHWLETLAQSAGAEVVKKAALLAEGNEWIDCGKPRRVWCTINHWICGSRKLFKTLCWRWFQHGKHGWSVEISRWRWFRPRSKIIQLFGSNRVLSCIYFSISTTILTLKCLTFSYPLLYILGRACHSSFCREK